MGDIVPLLTMESLRRETVGEGYKFMTPFGERRMVYADYTASGRTLRFIENYLMRIQESYANTHTEDDVTGKSTTELLAEAERIIKRSVGAGPGVRLIAAGTGSTGAIFKLQEILGVRLPPATRARLADLAADYGREAADGAGAEGLDRHVEANCPVVFVGPYEHHSNEVSWRECLAEVVSIGLTAEGEVDLADLEAKLADRAYAGRMKIGAFSAASNVTGMLSPVHEIARILHRHGAIATFDYAACAPYVEITMEPDEESRLDAVYLSPHKFLGGPGSSGILLFHESLYRRDLPPTCPSGGTVTYVGPTDHDFVSGIEEREKAGTPGTLQTLRAALCLAVKDSLGVEAIERVERDFIGRALQRFCAHPGIEVLGSPDPDKRIAIVSFLVRHLDRYLHPKLVTRLLNDLFGIQSRAGCSCAGPYGHALLGIGVELSERYREQVRKGYLGIKPGWVRLGFHYTMSEAGFLHVCEAVEFVAEEGHRFLPLYSFDAKAGTWTHKQEPDEPLRQFGLEAALRGRRGEQPAGEHGEEGDFAQAMAEAKSLARKSRGRPAVLESLPGPLEALSFFYVAAEG